jgi:hypothetical protein
LANVPEKPFIYTVGDAEEERTTLQKKGARLAVTEKKPLSKRIRGEPKLFTEKDLPKTLAYWGN